MANTIERRIIRHPDDHDTTDIMSPYEYANEVATRAVEIENGATAYVSVANASAIEIAEREIAEKKSPGVIRRYVRTITDADGVVCKVYEDRPVNSMIVFTY